MLLNGYLTPPLPRTSIHYQHRRLPHLLFLLFLYSLTSCSNGITAHTKKESSVPLLGSIPDTPFRCSGRSAGYYADPDTGCQVYHMCDILERQYSYLCPNYTLFNQKFMVCDHWYMVDCASAQTFYHLNTQIGEVPDKSEEEEQNTIRTGDKDETSPRNKGTQHRTPIHTPPPHFSIRPSTTERSTKDSTRLQTAFEPSETKIKTTAFKTHTKAVTPPPSFPTTPSTTRPNTSSTNRFFTPLTVRPNTPVSQSFQSPVRPQQSFSHPFSPRQPVTITQPTTTTTTTTTPTTPLPTQRVIPSRQPVTPPKQSFTPSRQPVTPSKQSFTPSRQPVTPSKQSFTPSRQSVSSSRQPVTPSKQTVIPSRQPVTPPKQPVTQSRQPFTSSRGPVSPSKQPVTPSRQSVGQSILLPVIPSGREVTVAPPSPPRLPSTFLTLPTNEFSNRDKSTDEQRTREHSSQRTQNINSPFTISTALTPPNTGHRVKTQAQSEGSTTDSKKPGNVARSPGNRFSFTSNKEEDFTLTPEELQRIVLRPLLVRPRTKTRRVLTSAPTLLPIDPSNSSDPHHHHFPMRIEFPDPVIPEDSSSRSSLDLKLSNTHGVEGPSPLLQPLSRSSTGPLSSFLSPPTHPFTLKTRIKQEFPTRLVTPRRHHNLQTSPRTSPRDTFLPGARRLPFPSSTRGNRDFFIPSVEFSEVSLLGLPRNIVEEPAQSSNHHHEHHEHGEGEHMTMVFPAPIGPIMMEKLKLNPDCPRCHPEFLKPGQCHPCVVIK